MLFIIIKKQISPHMLPLKEEKRGRLFSNEIFLRIDTVIRVISSCTCINSRRYDATLFLSGSL